jgi:hypothetical protein
VSVETFSPVLKNESTIFTPMTFCPGGVIFGDQIAALLGNGASRKVSVVKPKRLATGSFRFIAEKFTTFS